MKHKEYFLLVLVIAVGSVILFLRWKKLDTFYNQVVDRVGFEITAGNMESASLYIEYLETAGVKDKEVQEAKQKISSFKSSVQEAEETILPYIKDAKYSTALALLEKRTDLNPFSKQYLRQKIYDAWGWIVFSSNLTGSFELFAARPDASEIFKLTTNSITESSHDVSPDGTRIAYSRVKSESENKWLIALYDLTTGTELMVPIMGITLLDPSFSPDGNKLAYTSILAGYSYIMQYDFTLGETKKLARGYSANQPCFSKDGKKMMFEGRPAGAQLEKIQIILMNPDGSDVRPLTNVNKYSARDPKFSPNSESFVFRYDDDIFVQKIGAEPRSVSDPEYFEKQPDFSPDGTSLVYVATINGIDILVTQDLRNGKRFFFPDLGRAAQNPVWVEKLTLPPNAKRIDLNSFRE